MPDDGTHVIGIGGATLGGSYKTPLVNALALALGERVSVAVVASSYAATMTGPLRVSDAARPSLVGDEAAWLARSLGRANIPVFLGKHRADAITSAAKAGHWVLVDGLLQTRPRRLHRALLVLDGDRPWGAGRCPPAGDLRARRERLLAAADALVLVGSREACRANVMDSGALPVFWATSHLAGARRSGTPSVDLSALRAMRLGLVLAIGRPERVLETLALEGIRPAAVVLCADHARPALGRRTRPMGVEAWLTSAKCATKLGPELGGAPVWVLEHRLTVDPGLLDFVASPAPPDFSLSRSRGQTRPSSPTVVRTPL